MKLFPPASYTATTTTHLLRRRPPPPRRTTSWAAAATAVAVLTHGPAVSSAWVVRRPWHSSSLRVGSTRIPITSPYSDPSRWPLTPFGAGSLSQSYHSTSSTQLFAGPNKDSWWTRTKRAAKSLVPQSWLPQKDREEMQRAKLVQQQQDDWNNQISGGMTELLKGAPLPIRLVGRMVAPLLSSALSQVAQAAQEQQATLDRVLDQAMVCIETNDAVHDMLGSPVQVSSTPTSQSSSSASTNINGRTTMQQRIQVTLSVQGSRHAGVAVVTATEDGLQSIQVQAQGSGRLIQVPIRTVVDVEGSVTSISSTTTTSSNRRPTLGNKNVIVDAEIVDETKDEDRRRRP